MEPKDDPLTPLEKRARELQRNPREWSKFCAQLRREWTLAHPEALAPMLDSKGCYKQKSSRHAK